MSDAESNPKYQSQHMTPALWDAIKEAGRTGGLRAARLVWAQGRTSTSEGRPAGYRGLDTILEREPFRSEWARILDEFIGRFEEVAHKAALEPDTVRRFDPKTGRLIEERQDSRNRNWMLIQTLRRYDEQWRERKAVTVDGQIQHQHQHALLGPDTYMLSGSDVLGALSLEEQQHLFLLLEKVEIHKSERRDGTHHITNERQPARLETPSPGPDPD